MAIAAAIIFLQDFSNPFFVQNRVGKNLKVFKMYKIRSMKVNSEKAGYSTHGSDSRITPIGKIIRKTSIDELPQILNVFMGDMSLVGPRPDVPKQIEQYKSEQVWHQRHTVKPGITGLAQTKIRSNGTMEERTTLDLQYIHNVTLKNDFMILVETVYKVCKINQSN